MVRYCCGLFSVADYPQQSKPRAYWLVADMALVAAIEVEIAEEVEALRVILSENA